MGNVLTPASHFVVRPDAPLSDRDAWAIATAWHEHIANFLWLSGEHAADERPPPRSTARRFPFDAVSLSIDQSIEYIDFTFDKLHDEVFERTVLAARAATIAWFALSCCPGFSGRENPVFWRRVFAATKRSATTAYVAPGEDDWSHLHIVDTHRFFPHPDRPFPCVRVRGLDRNTFAYFFHSVAPSHRLIKAINKTLASALRELAPFICDARWEHPLSVTVCTSLLDSVQKFLHESPSASGVQAPRLQLAEVHCLGEVHAKQTELKTLLTTTTVNVRFVKSSHALNAILHVLKGSVCAPVATVELTWTAPSDRSRAAPFSAGCSVLPHARSIRGLRIVNHLREGGMNDVDAAWLGYAIFHPDANSSFTDLSFGFRLSELSALQRLVAMATGNNLLTAMGLSTATRTGYFQARLRPGTCVRSKPITNDEEQLSRAIVTFNAETWITVFPEDTTDAAFSRVVLPGFGLAWVSRDSIREVVERPAGPSCVRRLHLTAFLQIDMLSREHELMDAVFSLLAVLGRELEYLRLQQAVSVPTMTRILALCPNLSSLHVAHDGSCWAASNIAFLPALPRLRELHLQSRLPLAQLVAPQLHSLTYFQFCATEPSNSVQRNRASFLALLEQCPALEYVMWRSGNEVGLSIVDPQSVSAILRDVITRGVHDVAHAPLAVDERHAFLCAVRASDPVTTALGRLGSDLVRVIFSYCSSTVPRKFCVTFG